MGHPSWTDILQALAAAGSLVATVGGILLLSSQLRQVERTIRGDTNASLCAPSIDILNAIAECPESYACFYDDAPLPTDHKVRVKVLCVCEMIANYLDHVCQQKDNLPRDAWLRWEAFVYDTVTGCRVVQDHLCRFEKWYSPELLKIVRAHCRPSTATAPAVAPGLPVGGP
jgi:hypothetical protein